MLDIFKTILEVAKSLLGLSDSLKAADSKRKAEMATLFEKISDCLATVSSEIRSGNVPHGKCHELMTYAVELPALIVEEVGVERAKELGETLHSAYNVEGMAMAIGQTADKEPYLQQVEEASGKFRALANLLRVR